MKRKGSKKAQKQDDDSNGIEADEQDQLEENGGASEDVESDEVDDEPQEKKKKSTKSSRKNVSFSKKGSENDNEEVKKSKKKKSKESKRDEEKEEDEDAAEDEDDESQYEVEKVLDEKMIKGVRHYLIRWKGYEEESDTWEPEDTLNCANLIEAYKDSKTKGKSKKSRKPEKKHRGPNEEEWDENEDFEVEKILEVHHRKDGKREFLVVWKGYSSKDSSWEPEDNMNCKDLIEKFMAKVDQARNFEERELRVNRKHVQRLTYNTPDSNRRLSRRNCGKERVQYHDAE